MTLKPTPRQFAILSALAVLLSACRHPGGAKLAGTWRLDSVGPDGVTFHSVLRVSPDGRHSCQTSAYTNSALAFTVITEGTLQIKDGYLIETVTKHNEHPVSVPRTDRARIITFDRRKMVVRNDTNSVEVVWRKEQK